MYGSAIKIILTREPSAKSTFLTPKEASGFFNQSVEGELAGR
jgi:hypothetical protein